MKPGKFIWNSSPSVSAFVFGLLLAFFTAASGAAVAANASDKGKETVLDLSKTTLQTKHEFLDCLLRVEERDNHLFLNWSDGQVDLPRSAIQRDVDGFYYEIRVKGSLLGFPVSKIATVRNMRPDLTDLRGIANSGFDNVFLRHYRVDIAADSDQFEKRLRAHFPNNPIRSHDDLPQWVRRGEIFLSRGLGDDPGILDVVPNEKPLGRRLTDLIYTCTF